MKLTEIYDSEVDGLLCPVAWGWKGIFKWGEKTFSVELRKTRVPHASVKSAYEAYFFLNGVKGDDAFSTVDKEGSDKRDEVPVKVYGVVLNSLIKAWNDNPGIEAIHFTAEPRHSKDAEQHARKELLYDALARRAHRRGGGHLYTHRGSSSEWLLTRQPVEEGYWSSYLREEVEQLLLNGYVVKSV